jgi:hypothetical protein
MNTATRSLQILTASILLLGACDTTPTQPADTAPEIAFARLWGSPEEADKNKDGLVCKKADGTGFLDNRKNGCRPGFILVSRF